MRGLVGCVVLAAVSQDLLVDRSGPEGPVGDAATELGAGQVLAALLRKSVGLGELVQVAGDALVRNPRGRYETTPQQI